MFNSLIKAARSQDNLTSYLPYTSIYDDTLILSDGSVMASMLLHGSPSDSLSEDEQYALSGIVEKLLIQSNNKISIYSHAISRTVKPNLRGIEAPETAHELDVGWRNYIDIAGLTSEQTIITLIIRPSPIENVAAEFIRRLTRSAKSHEASALDAIKQRAELLEELFPVWLEALKPLRAQRLGVDDGEWFGLLRMLHSGEFEPRPNSLAQNHTPSDCMQAGEISFSGDKVYIKQDVGEIIGAIFSLTSYPSSTEPGVTASLTGQGVLLTQSWRPVDRVAALSLINLRQRQMSSAEDQAQSLRIELSIAADDLESGRTSFGWHHLSALIIASDVEDLHERCAAFKTAAMRAGLPMRRETFNMRPAFFAQHPGNFSFIARHAVIAARNFADLIYPAAAPTGPQPGACPWGDAISIMPTARGGAYRLSLHAEADPGERSAAHSLIIGKTGSGKSLLAMFLAAQALRFNVRIIAFDKDFGLQRPIQMLGGTYSTVRIGESARFNPFFSETDDRGCAWLTSWLLSLASADGDLTSIQRESLEMAVKANSTANDNLRNFSSFRAQLLSTQDGGELHRRLGIWDEDGANGWLFSGRGADSLALSEITAFDLTEILDAPALRTAWLSYVLRKVELVVADERPTLIIIDEAWRMLDDEYFAARLKNWMLTMRKKNAAVILLTQRVSHINESAAGGAILESASTLLAFPNPATQPDELSPLNLAPADLQFLTSEPFGRLALLRRGRAHSVVLNVDLTGLGSKIEYLKGYGAENA